MLQKLRRMLVLVLIFSMLIGDSVIAYAVETQERTVSVENFEETEVIKENLQANIDEVESDFFSAGKTPTGEQIENLETEEEIFEAKMMNSAEEGKILTYELNYEVCPEDNTASITGHTGNISGTLVIPDEIDGYKVTAIGDNAFEYCYNITSIVIPNTIKQIGQYAFWHCQELGSITIPEGVTSIETSTFSCCFKLNEVVIPESVTTIGETAFFSCDNLETIELPDSITEIGDYAFYECTKLKNITLPNKLKKIGERTFYTCSSIETITIPEGVTSLGEAAFKKCESLKKIVLPESVVEIADYVFSGCTNLKTAGAIGSGNNVEFGWKTRIPFNAFCDFDCLQSVVVPDGIVRIEGYSFHNCTSLESVSIPRSVLNIGNSSFNFGDSLKSVYYAGTSKQWDQIIIGNYNDSLSYATFYFNNDEEEIEQVLINEQNFPDPKFREELLKITYGEDGAFSVYELADITYLDVRHSGIKSLQGIEYFQSLKELECCYNQISEMPELPISIESLNCENNELTKLPKLPEGLKYLNCDENQLTSIPELPNGLIMLICSENQLTQLPQLPSTLKELKCNEMQISELPDLPEKLWWLECAGNYLKTLPSLPDTLEILACYRNNLGELPELPESLTRLNCANTGLTKLPELPKNLEILDCRLNRITELPTLPASLQNLYCSNNELKNVALNDKADYEWIDLRYNYIKDVSFITGNDSIEWDNNRYFQFTPQYDLATKVVSLRISSMPEKLEYNIGEKLDLSGLEIVACYADEHEEKIVGYTAQGYDSKTVGRQEVLIIYQNHAVSFEVEVKRLATEVFLDKTSLNLLLGTEQQLIATVKPVNATDKSLTWSSDNEKVVTVDNGGKVTTVGAGTAKITVTTSNGKTAACTVNVLDYSISRIELTFDLSGNSEPEVLTVSDGVKNITASWSSADLSVATVDKSGKVTPTGVGKTTITASLANGLKLTCQVTVNASLKAIKLNQTSLTLKTNEEKKLEVFFVPSATTSPKVVTWTSDNESVAMVGEEGNVTAVAEGTAKITAAVGELTAVCTVTVQRVVDEVNLVIPEVSAITNVQQALADIELPAGWSWENPEILLKQFAGTQEKSFAAVYKEEGAAPVYRSIPVKLISISKVAINAERTTMLKDTEMRASLVWTVTGEEPESSSYSVVWTSSNVSVASVDSSGLINAAGKGTAKIQAAVMVGNVTFKASYTVKVTEGTETKLTVTAVENAETSGDNLYTAALEGKIGVIKVAAENARKLTVVSSNTAVVAVGKVTAKDGDFTIPYTLKAAGTAKITITANDTLKTTKEIWLKVKDAAPSIDTTSLTINRLMTEGVKFHIYPAQGYEVIDPVLDGKDARAFTLETDGMEYILKANDTTVRGSYKIEVQVTADGKTYTFPLAVKVVETKAKVTVKQTSKVNLFYMKDEAATVLNFTTSETIINAELKDCDFELVSSEDAYLVTPKTDGLTTKCDKSGILSLTLKGYREPFTMSYTVGVEFKAPKLALTSKSSVLYPSVGIESANTSVTLNGESFILEGKTVTLTDAKGNELSGYDITTKEDNITIEKTHANAKAVSAMIKVQDSAWNAPVSLSYALKINTKTPSLKLSRATLQLNTNAETMAYDAAVTKILWKDATESVPEAITIAGADQKSQNVRNYGMILETVGDEIVVKMNNTAVAKGTYKFNVFVKVNDVYTAKTTLSVKVVDSEAKKSVALSSKGTIDVLNREGSGVVVTPSLKYVNGTVKTVSLRGRSAHLFDAGLADGKVIITAKKDVNLITKYSYGVNLVLTIENAEGKTMTVTMDELKMKLKQTKPSVKAEPKTAVFYSSVYNTVDLGIQAAIKGAEAPVITNVELLNYNNAFEYDHTMGKLTLKGSGEAAKGKSYNLQFRVTFKGQADNEAPVILKHKVTVK